MMQNTKQCIDVEPKLEVNLFLSIIIIYILGKKTSKFTDPQPYKEKKY